MKVSFLKFIVLISTLSLPCAQTQKCQEGDFVEITADDNAEPDTAIHVEKLTFETSTNIGEFKIGNETFSRVLKLELEEVVAGLEYNLNIKPNQTDFNDLVDFDGFTTYFTSATGQGLLIDVDTGGPQIRCPINLTITDTNNRVPQFDKKDKMSFTIPSTWNKEAPLNWNIEDRLFVTDEDLTEGEISIISSDDKLSGVATKTSKDRPHKFEIQLFLGEGLEVGSHAFKIKPNDKVNNGTELEVEITVEEQDLFLPRFRSEEYFIELTEIPELDTPLDKEIEMYDPDEELSGNLKRKIEYQVEDSPFQLEFNDAIKKLVVKEDVKSFRGKIVTVMLKGTQEGTEHIENARIIIKFPDMVGPEFSDNVYMEELETWPTVGTVVPLPPATPAPGDSDVRYAYDVIEPKGIEIPFVDHTLTFDEDLDPSKLNENNIIVIKLEARSLDPSNSEPAVATFVIMLPPYDSSTTETPCDCTTTPDPSTTCPTPDPCDCTTTPDPSTTCPTPDPCDCTTTPDPSITCPTPDPSTTCPTPDPCDCDCTTTPDPSTTCPTPDPCDCTTGNPTTDTSSPCQTTVDPISSSLSTDITCPTPDPCECTTTPDPSTTCPTPDPCDCTTTPDPSTTCPTPDPCPITPCPTPPECLPCSSTDIPSTPEPCTSSTTTSSTPKPCECDTTSSGPPVPCEQKDDEEDECSNTGLMVAVITTSVLCAASILAGGYCFWLYRKAAVHSTRFSRESLLSTPETEPSPKQQPRPSIITHDKRLSFGDTLQNRFVSPSSNPEPGFQNPSFSSEETPEIVTTTIPTTPTPAPTTIAPTTPAAAAAAAAETAQLPPAKKSNIKTPKEIEPDYEEFPIETGEATSKSAAPTDSQVEPSITSDTKSRVQFSPEDEYASLGGSDDEDERL